MKEGWKDIQYDEAPNWSYLGICPRCVKQHTDYDRRLESMGRQMGLTRQQIEQAKAEGVTTELGLRRIEKNSRTEQVSESIARACCDADLPASLTAATQEGWSQLQPDDGPGWNYHGVCPECRASENDATSMDTTAVESQKQLFV